MPFLYNFGALIPKNNNIMKKFIIALVAVVLGLSSCSKADKLIGSWKLEKLETVAGSVNSDYIGIDVTLTFTDNNMVNIVSKDEDGLPQTETAPYSVSGESIIVEDITFNFDINGKTLILSATIPEEGIGNVKLYFTRL